MGQTNAGTCGNLRFGDAIACSNGSAVGPFHFTGQYHDNESGLDYFQARHYSSSEARFVSPDPAGLAAVDPNNPQTWNRYAYVGNNPMGAVDPLGLDECVMAGGSISTSVSQETCTGAGNTWIKSNVTVEVTPDDSGGGLTGAELDAWELESQTYNFWVEQSMLLQPGSGNSGSSGSPTPQQAAPAARPRSFAQCVARGSDELNPANLIGLGNSQFAKGALGGPFSLAASAYAGMASAGSVGGFGSTTGLDAGSKLAAGISADPSIVIYPHFTTLTETPLITTWSVPVREAAEGAVSFFEKIDPIAYALDLTTTAFVAVGCAGFGQ